MLRWNDPLSRPVWIRGHVSSALSWMHSHDRCIDAAFIAVAMPSEPDASL